MVVMIITPRPSGPGLGAAREGLRRAARMPVATPLPPGQAKACCPRNMGPGSSSSHTPDQGQLVPSQKPLCRVLRHSSVWPMPGHRAP